jgi:hypothetical protein
MTMTFAPLPDRVRGRSDRHRKYDHVAAELQGHAAIERSQWGVIVDMSNAWETGVDDAGARVTRRMVTNRLHGRARRFLATVNSDYLVPLFEAKVRSGRLYARYSGPLGRDDLAARVRPGAHPPIGLPGR